MHLYRVFCFLEHHPPAWYHTPPVFAFIPEGSGDTGSTGAKKKPRRTA